MSDRQLQLLRAASSVEFTPRYGDVMRAAQMKTGLSVMHSQFNLWKTAIAIVIYVALCMLVIVFSPPDYAGRDGLVQTRAPVPAAATSASLDQEAS